MNWLVQKLAGAMIAGIGWKLGVDTYDAIKSKIKERRGDGAKPVEEDAGGAATGEAPVGMGGGKGGGRDGDGDGSDGPNQSVGSRGVA